MDIQQKRKNNWKKRGIILFLIFAVSLLAIFFSVNAHVVRAAEENLLVRVDAERALTAQELDAVAQLNADCILVLGAGLKSDGTPNHMLEDRLKVAILLYEASAAEKLLLSGDNGQEGYDEVNAMKDYVLKHGVAEEDIFLDHAGFSTYESMYRAKEIFRVETGIVVTQAYHEYRALYIGQSLGLSVYGVSSDQRTYVGQPMREFREMLARNKDFLKTICKPEPAYLGESIPINGSGLQSWD